MAVKKVEEITEREINYHLASKGEFYKKKKTGYFYKEIVENYDLLIGDEHEFKKIIESVGKRRKITKTRYGR